MVRSSITVVEIVVLSCTFAGVAGSSVGTGAGGGYGWAGVRHLIIGRIGFFVVISILIILGF
jgi:hypothetical protein